MVNENVIRKTKLISVKVPMGSRATEFFFPDQPDLRNALLLGLCIFDVKSTPKTYENTNTVNDPAELTSFITLYDEKGFAFVDKVPLVYFKAINSKYLNFWGTTFNGQKINWSKCYIHIADNSTISIIQDEYFQLLVSYEYPKPK